MPGPRAKGKSGRPKPRTASGASASIPQGAYTIPDGFFTDIDNAGTWRLIVDVLCDYLALPGTLNCNAKLYMP